MGELTISFTFQNSNISYGKNLLIEGAKGCRIVVYKQS
jgi:hypothetical protein